METNGKQLLDSDDAEQLLKSTSEAIASDLNIPEDVNTAIKTAGSVARFMDRIRRRFCRKKKKKKGTKEPVDASNFKEQISKEMRRLEKRVRATRLKIDNILANVNDNPRSSETFGHAKDQEKENSADVEQNVTEEKSSNEHKKVKAVSGKKSKEKLQEPKKEKKCSGKKTSRSKKSAQESGITDNKNSTEHDKKEDLPNEVNRKSTDTATEKMSFEVKGFPKTCETPRPVETLTEEGSESRQSSPSETSSSEGECTSTESQVTEPQDAASSSEDSCDESEASLPENPEKENQTSSEVSDEDDPSEASTFYAA